MPLRRFSVLGLNHRTASVAQREAFAFARVDLPSALSRLHQAGLDQTVLLSTCNRTEVYAAPVDSAPLRAFFTAAGGITGTDVDRCLYYSHGTEAARHLFRVAAGLDSQVLGESEILGQVKKAWTTARDEGFSGSFLDAAFQRALVVGKRVRAETDLGKHAVSVASLAFRLALQQKRDFENADVLVVGTGEMASRIVRELIHYPPRHISVVSHSMHLAEALADEACGTPLAIGQLGEALAAADVVFTVTAAPHPIIEKQALARLEETRAGRPLYIFDLAVPRNTEPEVSELPFTYLHDIEALQELSEAHRQARAGEVPAAESVVEEEVTSFVSWCKQRGVAPLIHALRHGAEAIRREHVDWAVGKMGEINECQREVIDMLTARLVKRLLRYPITELKNSAGEEEALAFVGRMMGMSAASGSAELHLTSLE